MKEIEKVVYQDNAPKGVDPDGIYFVQVDPTKCRGCGECDNHCATGAIQSTNEAGIRQVVNVAACVNCGQCLIHCPYGAIYEGVTYVDEIAARLKDKDTVVVSMPAPAVRYALGECFGYPPGTYVGGKMHAALKKLGFKYIWDNEYTADVTIMEEGTELIDRIAKPAKERPLPQFTSCCPGWMKFVESFYPDLLPHVFDLQVPHRHAGGPGQDLWRRDDQDEAGEDVHRIDHALYREKVRRAEAGDGVERIQGHRRHHQHERTRLPDQTGRDRLQETPGCQT